MHVVIVGCGRVGSGLARALDEAGESVAVIDRRPDAFRRLGEGFGGRLVVGVGFDRGRLREAGIDDADALAAVTSGDNTNIVTARVARETFQVPRVVARIYDPRRAEVYERLGISTVATVGWAIERVLHRIRVDSGAVAWADPTGGVRLVERVLPAAWSGRPIAEMVEPARAVVLSRGGVARVPEPELLAQEDDVLYVAGSPEHLAELDERLTIGPEDGAA